MKVLVAGPTGWIGGYVLKELLKNPWVEIIAPIGAGSFPKVKNERIKYIHLDNVDFLPDAIIYLAWPHLDYYDSPNHIRFAMDSFVYLKSFVDRGVRNITVTGTCFEYGKKALELSEDMPADPHCNYAIGKDALRRMLSTLDIDLKWLRLFYLYGDGQRAKSLVPRFLKAIENEEPTFEVSGMNKIRDYLEVSEAAKYIVACAMQTETTGIINVCSGRPMRIAELLESHVDECLDFIEIKESSEEFPDYGAHSFWGNNEKLKRIIK